jgi:hypothetical protein
MPVSRTLTDATLEAVMESVEPVQLQEGQVHGATERSL